MCTIGYNKRLNLLYKNRDKTSPAQETLLVRDAYVAVKTEGASYFSLGVNTSGCGFVSAAINTPAWTALAAKGLTEEANAQLALENEGLTTPMERVSTLLPSVKSVEEWIEALLKDAPLFRGYNLILADREKAAHVELYRDKHHVAWLGDWAVLTNHFQHLSHGPVQEADYPSSYERLRYAQSFTPRLVTIEDLFKRLTPSGHGACPAWREGNFHTVSSSVADLDNATVFYATSPDGGYSRVSRTIPAKGAEKTALEMSRYIDLPTYHNIERGHPFYEEMLEEVVEQVRSFSGQDSRDGKAMRILELGAGTGLLTLELAGIEAIELNCLELDAQCCNILRSHPESKCYSVIHGDAVTFSDPEGFDLIVSTFAHDHIHFNRRFNLAANIRRNLRPGGRYVMGGELLPYFSTDSERKKSLFRYHNHIIELALREGRIQLCELENNALKSGLDMVGDFKRHEAMFEDEMRSSGMGLVKKVKLGPLDRDDVGGVFVYVYEA